MDIKLWIEYRNSFYSEVPIEKNTKEIQRMLSVYSTGRDCALNAAEDLNFEDISHYPTVDAFIKKCGFNIGCWISKMNECLNIVSNIDISKAPNICPNMLNLFTAQLELLKAVLKKIEELKNEVKNSPQKMKANKDKPSVINNYNIGTMQGILGNVSDSNITQNLSISKGNIDELKDTLEKYAIPKLDLDELVNLLEQEPQSTPTSFPQKINQWIGKMIQKAVDGVWNISVSAAGTLLSTSIGKYYGM